MYLLGSSYEGADGRDADYGTSGGRLYGELGSGGLDGIERAGEVCGEGSGPERRCDAVPQCQLASVLCTRRARGKVKERKGDSNILQKLLELANPRIADEHIQPSPSSHNLLDQLLPRFGICNVPGYLD